MKTMIRYQTIGWGKLTTICPFGMHDLDDKKHPKKIVPIKVGSIACHLCRFFVSDDQTTNTLVCKGK